MNLTRNLLRILRFAVVALSIYFGLLSTFVMFARLPHSDGQYYFEVTRDITEDLRKGDMVVAVNDEKFETVGGLLFVTLKHYFISGNSARLTVVRQ